MKNRILVTSAGRSPALNFCRSLRVSGEDFFIVGIDDNKYSLSWAEVDEKVLIPKDLNEEDYINLINHITRKYNIEFIYPSKTNLELLYLSSNREKLQAKIFLPDKEDVDLFEDKWETYLKVFELDKNLVPLTFLIHNSKELFSKMQLLSNNFNDEVWIRRVYGSGGSCAIATCDFELANAWIRRFNGWGKFTISKKLTNKTLTWSGIWNKGKLVASLIRERLYWEFADRAPAGVTGITGGQKIVYNEDIDKMSINLINKLSKSPNGTICVDYTVDDDGALKLTEIQASRLYTSSYFMTKCGINLPFIFYKVCMNKEITPEEVTAKIEADKVWLKYVEMYPILKNENEFAKLEKEMISLLKEVKN